MVYLCKRGGTYAKEHTMIYVVDFGSQTCHLIARRLRDLSIAVEIVQPENVMDAIRKQRPVGIILSGGPSSVYEKNAPTIDKRVFEQQIPVLGICYGLQTMARVLKGKVVSGHKEYGPTTVTIKKKSQLLEGIRKKTIAVWMSHGDEVQKLPDGFQVIASTKTVQAAVIEHTKRHLYALQFHPEVLHTQHGLRMLKNFATLICHVQTKKKKIEIDQILQSIQETVNEKGKDCKVIAAVSGGVDSTVASALIAKAIGKRFIPIYCDNGLMREGTAEELRIVFEKQLKVKPMIVDCKKEFLRALRGVTDPEQKRKIIGKLYIEIFERTAASIPNVAFLAQGTIYSDVIESKGSKNASKIKSHHNVGGLPKNMKYSLLEPLREFYKDEVRTIGTMIGLPESVTNKQPFPGPGYAIRILGEVTEERLQCAKQADAVVLEELHRADLYGKVFQSFPVMTGAMTTAVKGDARVYGELVGLRIYDSDDIMTAGWSRIPYDVLQVIASRIVNEVPGVSRVAYDITTKPPATMEWE